MKTSRWVCVFLVSLLALMFGLDNFGTVNSANREIVDSTLTSEPTIEPRQAAFEKLMQENGGCEFPCWWGFELGKTTEDEWFKFLDALPFKVFREDPLSDGTTLPLDYGYFSFPQSTSSSYLHYDFQDGMLSKVSLQLQRTNEWLSKSVTAILLPGLLKRLDQLNQTPEIYMYIGGTSSSLDLPFLIVADDVGVMAQYEFNISDTLPAPNDPKQWRYCLGLAQTTRIEITVQDPKITPKVSARARNNEGWVRLEDLNVLRMDSNDFIQFFIDTPDLCFVPKPIKPEANEPS